MKKFISAFVSAIMFFSVYTFPVSALNDEISDIEVNYELLDLDLSSDAETYEKTIYLYPKEVLEDGTILVGVTDDTDDLVSTGSYTISMKSGSISVCDVVHPEVSESARPDCSDYVLKVT